MATPMTPLEEMALRESAMRWLERRSNDGLEALRYDEIEEFPGEFRGRPIALKDRQRGIFKPAVFQEAALSVTTTFRAPGAERPYDDAPGPDGLLRYKWRGEDPEQADNRALRAAMAQGVPLIWFYGVAEGLYQPVFPVYLVAEEPEHQQFAVLVGEENQLHGSGVLGPVDFVHSPLQRRYAMQLAKRRLHQPVFRSQVLAAYQTRCAVCSFRHGELLDAAHIVPDSHERGIADVTNGLSLCKIHHSAFDIGFLGIRPDHVIEIRQDLLKEIDGPMLRHGLQELHHEKLRVLPGQRRSRPSSELLEIACDRFRRRASA